MGTFKQHIEWSEHFILLMAFLIIIVLLWLPDLTVGLITESSPYWPIGVMLIPFIFIFGAVSPDIDLDRSKIVRWQRILLPIGFGLGVGGLAFRFVAMWIDEQGFDLSLRIIAIITISVVVGLILGYLLVVIVSRFTTHWGVTHSLIATIIAALIVTIIVTACWSLIWGIILGMVFGFGYLHHLIVDQAYHELRSKQWKDKRYALKIFSNKWEWDPLIILFEAIK